MTLCEPNLTLLGELFLNWKKSAALKMYLNLIFVKKEYVKRLILQFQRKNKSFVYIEKIWANRGPKCTDRYIITV
jgi:hypothetical protein